MPHTKNRKKAQRTKRREVAGEDGWTRISSSRSQTSSKATLDSAVPSRIILSGYDVVPPQADKTVEMILEEFSKVETQWLQSTSYTALSKILDEKASIHDFNPDLGIVFGTGTFCGSHGQQFIERHHVAYYQLAVFKSMMRILEKHTGRQIPAFAQEPIYNSLDVEFLSATGIAVKNDPQGFEIVTDKSFVYSPGAELFVTRRIVYASPAVYLCHNLDQVLRMNPYETHTHDADSDIDATDESEQSCAGKQISLVTKQDSTSTGQLHLIEDFLKRKDAIGIPEAEYRDRPFFDQYLYWPKTSGATANPIP